MVETFTELDGCETGSIISCERSTLTGENIYICMFEGKDMHYSVLGNTNEGLFVSRKKCMIVYK